MGTIANKLTYLNTTKTMLRDSLNKFGSNILTTDTFRSYDTKLNDIYDKLPKVTQSGAGLTITPVQNGLVDDFKMIGTDLEQNGTPTPDNPQEIKVVEGRQAITNKRKNLLKPYTETTERYGITASYDENTHIYTFNGTCTRDNVTFILSSKIINFTNGLTKSITYWVGGSCNNNCDIRHFNSNYTSSVIYSITNISSSNNKISKTSSYTFESPSNFSTIRFDNGSVANNLQIKVMVTDDDNTDYEPYYNPVSYNIDLNLENIYLAKIPNTNYKNRIYKSNGNWYYEKIVEKVILDGNAIWYKYNNNFCLESITNYNRITNIPICTHFKGIDMTIGTNIPIAENEKTIRFGNNENASAYRVFIIDSDFSDAGALKDFLLTHDVELWYILENPVTTQITNTTLINQLNAISTFKGTNIFTISNDNNVIPEIEITRLKELERLS